MAFGIQLYNDSGSVLLDDLYVNMQLSTKLTINSMTPYQYSMATGAEVAGDYADLNKIYFLVDAPVYSSPIVAVTSPTGRAIAPDYVMDPAYGNTPAGYKRFGFSCDGTTAATITAYVYDKINPATLTSTGFGVEFRNPSNEIIYHFTKPVLKPTNLITLRGNNVVTTTTVSSAKSYAFIFCNPTQGSYLAASTSQRPIMSCGLEITNSTTISQKGVNDSTTFPLYGSGAKQELSISQAFIVEVTYS